MTARTPAISKVIAVLLLLAAALSAAPLAGAETLEAADAEELLRLLTEARQEGAQVVVIEAPAGSTETDPAASKEATATEQALLVRKRAGFILASAGNFLTHAGEAIRQHDPDGSAFWPVVALLQVLAFLVVGYGAGRLFHAWARPHFRDHFNPSPQSEAEKISYLLLRGLMQLVGLAITLFVAVLVGWAFDQGNQAVRDTWLVVIGGVGLARGLSIFFFNLLAPDTPSHRLLYLSDEGARSLYRNLHGLLLVIAVAVGFCLWMNALHLSITAHALSLIASTLLAAILIVGFAIWRRRLVAGMILGPGPLSDHNLAVRLLAEFWHVLALVYFVVAWIVSSIRLVLGQPNALGLVTGPLLVLFGAIAVYGLALLLIEWAFRGRKPAPVSAQAVAPAQAAALAQASVPAAPDAPLPDETPQDVIPPDEADADPDHVIKTIKTFRNLAREGAGLLVTLIAIEVIFDLWGLSFTAPGSLFYALWEVMLVGFLAYLAFESVRIWIDRKIMEEGGFDDEVDEDSFGEEGSAQSASRLATLLPLFRNFLLILIAAIAAMIALSELGLDIAPLFAGAGVVGIAIGFGAQTLIRDIFSGAFYLMDDAFRKGEYIDIGDVKGTVEKISVRSMQLRHHMGPLHTVPFGEIQFLTNYSRDWVMMKLPLRVTYDTDVEKVRKLIKALGQELQQDPVIGDKFLQPLKSQGVYKMEDSAMIIRVKFMTRPGDQFMARKKVYAEIRKLFEREDIHFAHREVTVRLADDDDDRQLSDKQKEAIVGAVRPVIDDLGKPGGSDDGADQR